LVKVSKGRCNVKLKVWVLDIYPEVLITMSRKGHPHDSTVTINNDEK